MTLSQILFLIVGISISAVLAIFLLKRRSNNEKSTVEHIQVFNQRLDSMTASVNQALRDTLKLVTEQLETSRQSVERSTQNVHQQVAGFTSGLTALTEHVKQVQTSVKSVSSFQDIFKSPKLRGQWGESSLEASLAQYFSKDGYILQHYFSSGEAVDAILKLPNGLLLPVDSKFNWENFEKMVNADNDIAKAQYQKAFFSDVKKKIDEIAGKYILPAEETTDFALMYVPAETVYYEIINHIKDADIPAYARGKKVFLTSPNTFGLSVSAIMHWVKDVQLNKQTKEIMKRLERIAADGHKLGDDFRKLGNHIANAQGAFESSDKRLGLMLDRVENVIESGDGKEEPLVIDKPVKSDYN